MVKKVKKQNNNTNLCLFDTLNKEVTYRNDFSNTIFTNFSLKEKQLLLFLIAGIDVEEKIYNYNPKEIKTMLNMSRKTYLELSELINSIQKKPLVILENKKTISISIFDKVIYEPEDTSITVRWGYSAKELFKNLKGNFSKYFSKNIGNLKIENSIEFYLKAESNLFKGFFNIGIEDMKTIFNVNYTTKELKRSIVKKCVNDINNNTDITLEVTDIKQGNKITGFSFNVGRKNSMDDNLIHAIEKAKKNIHIEKSGLFNSSETEKTIHKLLRTFSVEELEKGLKYCYSSIKKDFKSISYLGRAIKLALEKNKEHFDKKIPEKFETNETEEKDINKLYNQTLILNSECIDDKLFHIFTNLDLEKKNEIEKMAVMKYLEEKGEEKNILITMKDMKKNAPSVYYKTLKKYITEVMKSLSSNSETVEEKTSAPKKRGRRKKLDMIEELDKKAEITKNEKAIKTFMKKKYGNEKMLEMLQNTNKYEDIMFEEYIALLREKENKR